MAPTSRVAVVGAGISGLSCAFLLDQMARTRGKQVEICLFDAANRCGGTIRTEVRQGYQFEWGPAAILPREPRTLELIERLGLSERLQWSTDAFRSRFIWHQGKLHKVPNGPAALFSSELLAPIDRLRLVAEPLMPRRLRRKDESLAEFGTRRFGKTFTRIMLAAVQRGIFAGDIDELSAAAAFPQMVAWESKYGSVILGALAEKNPITRKLKKLPKLPRGLFSLKDGLQQLTDTLADRLAPNLRLGTPITRLTRDAKGYTLSTPREPDMSFDQVVLAAPAFASASMLRSTAPALAEHLAEISYAPMSVVALGYKRSQVRHPLDGFGFLTAPGDGLQIIGNQWTSSVFPGRAPDDDVLVRTMFTDAALLAMSDNQVGRIAHGDLSRALEISGEPRFQRVISWPHAIPQYTVGHPKRLQAIGSELGNLPGLHLLGNAYHGVGVNDCIRGAYKTAEALVGAAHAS